VFAVVDNEQQLLVSEVGAQELQGRRRSLVSEVEGCDHGVGHEGFVVYVGQFDEPGAVREPPPEVGCSADRQTRLSDAAWPDEADHSGSRQLLPDLGQLAPAPDEAGRISRKVAQTAPRSCHDRRLRRPAALTDPRIINPDDMGVRLSGQPEGMTHRLPTQRVQVIFVGIPPARQVARASGVSEVKVDGRQLSCLVRGSFQPFLEALRGSEVISLTSTPTLDGG
jgi:hypothetical protein